MTPPVVKDEDRRTFESMMKRVNSKADNMEEEQQTIVTRSNVIVNARNVRILDKLMSKKCKKCNSIKPPHSHHCSTCRRCVAKMDHHCPWVNNCVGFYTQKHFILFLLYVFLGSGHALYILFRNGLYCLDKNCAIFMPVSNIILTIVAIFLALLFCLFVSIMFCDQISCIISNVSTIDKLQKTKEEGSVGRKKTKWERLDEVFNGGHGFSIWTLLPTDVPKVLSVESEF